MSDKEEIYRRIDEIRELLSSLENVSPDEDDAFGFVLSRQSLEGKLEELRSEVLEELDQEDASLFDYRIFADDETPIKMGAVGHALANFQTLFGMVVDAIKNGPKLRATIDAAMSSLTAFSFERAYEGSAGFVFTISDQSVLFGQTDVQLAFDILFSIAQARTHDEINAFAKLYGAPVIRKLYIWANDNAKYGVGADMLWNRLNSDKAALKLEPDSFLKLKTAISETSNEEVVPLEVSGILQGIDVKLPSFHLDLPDDTKITGNTIAEHLKSRVFEVPKFHHATINKKTIVHYAIDKETTTYELMTLD